jgi:hypothetical protein
MDFIEFVTSLAPEGETVLFVQQKTKAWIPQLPSAPRRAGGAWYVSSGSFILDRMTGGLSASAANCTHVTFLAVDDVGTKSKIPPLPPTWIIETSPGNYQWAWVLSEQVPLGVAGAAERAFAEAGYTDGGAITSGAELAHPRLDQSQRGPQPLRRRPDRVPPRARLHRRAGLRRAGRHPDPADTATVRPVTLDDDGTDDVLAWLSEAGHLTARGNAAGWWGVVCPNSEAHTTGEIEGRYMPVNRAYTCLHAHCAEWTAPASSPGWPSRAGRRTRPAARGAAGRRDGDDARQDHPRRPLQHRHRGRRLDRRRGAQRGRAGREGRLVRAVRYLLSTRLTSTCRSAATSPVAVFNALFRHIACHSIHVNADNKARRVEASICFDENRQSMGAPALAGVTYSPGDDVLVTRDGDVFGNMWRDARPPVNRSLVADISPWLDHCAALIPERATASISST